MDHKTCRENLSAYLDGELPPQERLPLENHLAGCPECSGILHELKSVSLIFKKHAVEPIPHSLKEKALGGRRKKPVFYPWLKPLLAVSTAAAGVLIVLNVTKSPEPEPAPLPALPKHAVFGPAKARMSGESGLYEGNAAISAGSLSREESEPARTPQASMYAGAFGRAKAARAGYAGAKYSFPKTAGAHMSAKSGPDAGTARLSASPLSGAVGGSAKISPPSMRTGTFAQSSMGEDLFPIKEIQIIHESEQGETLKYSIKYGDKYSPTAETVGTKPYSIGFDGGEILGEKHSVKIIPKGNIKDDPIKVEQRFANSLVIWDEGPRHYAGDWKEYISPWLTLKKIGRYRFQTLPVREHPESRRFVDYEPSELYKAVLRSGGKRWANMLPFEYRADDDPKDLAYEGAMLSAPEVTVGYVQIRVSVSTRGTWKEIVVFTISNPEGQTSQILR